jgi:hypothetical protein
MLQRHYGIATAMRWVGLKARLISGFFSRFLSSTWIGNVDLESRDDQLQAKSEKRASFLDVADGAAHPTGKLYSFSIMPALRAQRHNFAPPSRHRIRRGREEELVVEEILANRPTLVIRNSPSYKCLNSNGFLWAAFNETSLIGPVGWPDDSLSLLP